MTSSGAQIPIELAAGESVRWFGRTPDGRRSSSWSVKLARNTSDVYLMNRSLGGVVKVTIHAGISQVSFVNDDVAALWRKSATTRHLDRWDPPPDFAPGWKRLFEVVMPGPEMRAIVEADTSGLLALECPPQEAVHVVLLAGRRRSGAAGLVVKRGNVLARGPIDGETSLAVVGQIGPWGRAEAAFVEIERTGGSVVPRITGPDQSPPSEITRMPMWGLNRDGRRFVIDAAGVPLTP